jgi:hypothetical protein
MVVKIRRAADMGGRSLGFWVVPKPPKGGFNTLLRARMKVVGEVLLNKKQRRE